MIVDNQCCCQYSIDIQTYNLFVGIITPPSVWKEPYKRRMFFDELAREMGYDPVYEFHVWYNMPTKTVMDRPVRILFYLFLRVCGAVGLVMGFNVGLYAIIGPVFLRTKRR